MLWPIFIFSNWRSSQYLLLFPAIIVCCNRLSIDSQDLFFLQLSIICAHLDVIIPLCCWIHHKCIDLDFVALMIFHGIHSIARSSCIADASSRRVIHRAGEYCIVRAEPLRVGCRIWRSVEHLWLNCHRYYRCHRVGMKLLRMTFPVPLSRRKEQPRVVKLLTLLQALLVTVTDAAHVLDSWRD